MKNKFKKLIGLLLIIVTIFTTGVLSPVQVYANDKKGKQMVAEIIKELDLDGLSYYTKICVAGNWVAYNIDYSLPGDGGAGHVYETMRTRKAYCEGYARVFKEFMDQLGVPCLFVQDFAMDHSYNMVLLNDYKWYLVEPQRISGGDFERDIYQHAIDRVLSEIEYFEFMDTEDAEEEIRINKEKINKLNGRGEFIHSSGGGMPYFMGTNEYLIEETGEISSYYEFYEIAQNKVYGYPVSVESQNKDPNENQEKFVSKSTIAFKNKKITINAAKTKTGTTLPLTLKNYGLEGITYSASNIVGYNSANKKIKGFSNDDIYFLLQTKNRDFNHKFVVAGEGDVSKVIFNLNAHTIYGDKATTQVSIIYPGIQAKVEQKMASNFKVGEKVKLQFTNGTTINDYDVYLDDYGKQFIEYNKKTGEIKAKKAGESYFALKSKTNKDYVLDYAVNIRK